MVPNYLERLLNDQPEWREEAVCATVDPDLWYPKKSDAGAAARAKRLCFACPVRAFCLQEALDNDERFGVWGGLTERERRPLQRREQNRPRNRVDPVLVERGLAMIAAGMPSRQVAAEIGVSRSVLQDAKRRRRAAA